jgi:glycosyltransferase involved in cell wall biosynthesis
MKIVYVHLDPLKYPRIRKILHSVKRCGHIEFHVMMPKIRVKRHGNILTRALSATVNYSLTLLQILFLKADVFWVANVPDILVFPLLLKKKHYILEYRSPWSLEVEKEFGSRPLVRLSSIFENIALRHASVITLPTRKLLVRVRNFGKPAFVIPNYPLKSFKASIQREKFRRQHDVGNGEKVVLFIGRLSTVEGADMLPNIITKVLEKDKNVVFWVVGDGPLLSSLNRFAEKVPRKLRLSGWQPHQSIPDFINSADICIVPRHASPHSVFYNEENVQKISEYMHFKKPIVACGIAESEEYLLVKEDEMVDGIIRALNGEVALPNSRAWEDNSEKGIFEMLNMLSSQKTVGEDSLCPRS